MHHTKLLVSGKLRERLYYPVIVIYIFAKHEYEKMVKIDIYANTDKIDFNKMFDTLSIKKDLWYFLWYLLLFFTDTRKNFLNYFNVWLSKKKPLVQIMIILIFLYVKYKTLFRHFVWPTHKFSVIIFMLLLWVFFAHRKRKKILLWCMKRRIFRRGTVYYIHLFFLLHFEIFVSW